MLKGKELLDYTLDKINRKSKLHAISELAPKLLDLDERHRMLICLANKIDAYEYLFKEILALENSDELLVRYLEEHNYPAATRWGWKHIRIIDSREEVLDECEWFENKRECYCSMWKSVIHLAEYAIELSSTENPLVVTSHDIDWVRFEKEGVVNLFTVYEIE